MVLWCFFPRSHQLYLVILISCMPNFSLCSVIIIHHDILYHFLTRKFSCCWLWRRNARRWIRRRQTKNWPLIRLVHTQIWVAFPLFSAKRVQHRWSQVATLLCMNTKGHNGRSEQLDNLTSIQLAAVTQKPGRIIYILTGIMLLSARSQVWTARRACRAYLLSIFACGIAMLVYCQHSIPKKTATPVDLPLHRCTSAKAIN